MIVMTWNFLTSFALISTATEFWKSVCDLRMIKVTFCTNCYFATEANTDVLSLQKLTDLVYLVVFNWLVWRSANGVRHINKVKPRRAQLELQGTGDHLWQLYHPGIYQGHAGQLSLAIPKWSGAMSTSECDGLSYSWERNDGP